MNTPLPLRLLCLLFAGACMNASANDVSAAIRQRGQLVAGVHYVAPAYTAGAKFRTPETVDAALAEDVAKRLQVALVTLRAEHGKQAQLLTAGKTDIVLAAFPGVAPALPSAVIVPTGYSAGPMAIMRSDTDIKTWEQLKGRKVCLSEDGRHVGTIAARYGANEMVFKAPADSLLALRTGACDAAVHDSVLLEELIKLPEWKKFSARLPVGQRTSLAFAVSAGDAATVKYLKQVTSEWQRSGYLQQLANKMTRSIAFEVYLDQDVPDCH